MLVINYDHSLLLFTWSDVYTQTHTSQKNTIELRIIQNNECNKMKIKPGTMARSMTMEKRIK